MHGVGEKKAKDYGPAFVECVVAYCQEHKVELDTTVEESVVYDTFLSDKPKSVPNSTALQAFELFRQGQTIAQVAPHLDRALSTTLGYLIQYIDREKIVDAHQWVADYDIERIEVVADYAGTGKLKPIFDALHGQIGFDAIRIVLACRSNREISILNESDHDDPNKSNS